MYEWFRINKPFTKQKAKPSALKPTLSMTSKANVHVPTFTFLERPQTAPAVLYQVCILLETSAYIMLLLFPLSSNTIKMV